MAEGASPEAFLEKFESQLNCPICFDTYVDPKILPCFHVYCQRCLLRLVSRSQQGQLVLTCPNCRQTSPVPANGVAGFQSAFYMNSLLEIKESFKGLEFPSSSPVKAISSATYCSEHPEEELKLYCGTCDDVICFHCALKGNKHHSHDYELLHKAYENYMKEMTPSLELVKKQLAAINGSLAGLDTCCGKIHDQKAAIEADIIHTVAKLHKDLEVRKTELIHQLHQITQMKLKDLQVQKDQLETIAVRLHSCLEFMDHTGCKKEVLVMKSGLINQVKELTTTIKPDDLEPNAKADMEFSTSENITELFRDFGKISAANVIDPSKSHATGKGIQVAVAGEISRAVLQTVNFKNQPCTTNINFPECELESELTGAKTRGTITKESQGHYQILYRPAIKGPHQLHLKINGRPINGSPFQVMVTSPIEKLGAPILSYVVKSPTGITIKKTGQVIVSEQTRNCCSVFARNGAKLQSFGEAFLQPDGVALHPNGTVLVTDSQNDCIRVFSPEGKFLRAVGNEGRGNLQFRFPSDILFNKANGKVYVVDQNDRVQVLNSDLSFFTMFGKKGNGMKQFSIPCGIACDSSGNIYVADSNNHRIQVLTADGKFLRLFGCHGEAEGQLNWPRGIAVDDASGMIYVCESRNHRISVFTTEGRFVKCFGSNGTNPGEFDTPRGIAIDCGVIYVCDYKNDRDQLF